MLFSLYSAAIIFIFTKDLSVDLYQLQGVVYGALFVVGVGFVLVNTNMFNVLTACATVIAFVSSLAM